MMAVCLGIEDMKYVGCLKRVQPEVVLCKRRYLQYVIGVVRSIRRAGREVTLGVGV